MGLKKLEWKADTVSKELIKWFDDSENRLRDSSRSTRSTRFRYHRQNCIATLAQSCTSKESRSRLFYWVLGGKIVFDREKNKRFYVEIKKNRVFIFCGKYIFNFIKLSSIDIYINWVGGKIMLRLDFVNAEINQFIIMYTCI